MTKASFIIVNYNTRDVLEKCLTNLKNQFPESEIVVVDNGSTDGSAGLVKEKYPEIKLIETTNNGLAAGHNLGVEHATGDFLVYLGTDAFPTAPSVSALIAAMEEDPKIGVATAKLVLRDGTVDIDAHRGFPTPWASLTHFAFLDRFFPKSKLLSQYNLGYKNTDEPHEIDLCISHFMVVRRGVQQEVGRWDEDFFVFGEDVDFCYRVKQLGYKIMYFPKIEVLHYKGVGVGRKNAKDIVTASSASKATVKKMRDETTRAMRLFYQKHYAQKYPKALTWLVFLGIYLLRKSRNFFVKLS